MDAELANDPRQRAADIVAVMMVARFIMHGVEPDFPRLGELVAIYCAAESPETLQRYSGMDWQEAVGSMKIAFAKHYLAGQQAGPDELPPAAVDAQIGHCLVTAFFKFVTFRSINPGWYAQHLADMQLATEPMPSA